MLLKDCLILFGEPLYQNGDHFLSFVQALNVQVESSTIQHLQLSTDPSAGFLRDIDEKDWHRPGPPTFPKVGQHLNDVVDADGDDLLGVQDARHIKPDPTRVHVQ